MYNNVVKKNITGIESMGNEVLRLFQNPDVLMAGIKILKSYMDEDDITNTKNSRYIWQLGYYFLQPWTSGKKDYEAVFVSALNRIRLGDSLEVMLFFSKFSALLVHIALQLEDNIKQQFLNMANGLHLISRVHTVTNN